MTKEQEEAIKYLEFMNSTLDFNKLGYVYAKESIATVLNMLKEKDNKINELSKKLYLCTPEISQCQHGKYVSYVDLINKIIEKDKEIEKKDKIIDLITDSFQQICVTPQLAKYWWKRICKKDSKICEGRLCEDCIKQYFESKIQEQSSDIN